MLLMTVRVFSTGGVLMRGVRWRSIWEEVDIVLLLLWPTLGLEVRLDTPMFLGNWEYDDQNAGRELKSITTVGHGT